MSDWDDLAEAIELFRYHPVPGVSPFHCEHDELWVMADATQCSPEVLARLDELGFFVTEENTFKSFRFGSA